MRLRKTAVFGVTLLAVAMTLAACGSGAVETNETVATTAAAPTTSSTTTSTTTTTLPPTTTTTLAPLTDEEILSAFLDSMTDPDFQSEIEVDLRYKIDDFEAVGTGDGEIHGADVHTVVDFGEIGVIANLTVDDVAYIKQDDGPWVSEVDPDAVDASFGQAEAGPPPVDTEALAWLATLNDLEHLGTTVEDGVTRHHIGLPEGVEADPTGLGFSADEDVSVHVDAWADDRGTPLTFKLRVVQRTDEGETIEMDIRYDFLPTDRPIVIAEPAVYWVEFTSEEFAYTIGHPRTWDTLEERGEFVFDAFIGPMGEELDVYRIDLDDEALVPLNGWVNQMRTVAEDDWGYTSGEVTEFQLGFAPARKMVFSGAREYNLYVVMQTAPDTVFEFIFWGLDDEQENAHEMVDDFLATFSQTD